MELQVIVEDFLSLNPIYHHGNYNYLSEGQKAKLIDDIYSAIIENNLEPILMQVDESDYLNGEYAIKFTNEYFYQLLNLIKSGGWTEGQNFGAIKSIVNALALGGVFNYAVLNSDTGEYDLVDHFDENNDDEFSDYSFEDFDDQQDYQIEEQEQQPVIIDQPPQPPVVIDQPPRPPVVSSGGNDGDLLLLLLLLGGGF